MNSATTQLADSQHPWVGLASFTEGDREFFAGRGEEIEELLRLVRRDTLTLVHGISGLGKTSLLQAGLFPALRAEDYLPVPIRLDFLEGAAPLAAQVFGAITTAANAARVEAPQPRPDETLWEYFHREGNHFWSPRNDLITPFLAFDQFEEIFTLGRETPERATRATAFISELADLVENRPPAALRDDPLRAKEFSFKPAPLKVLLAMREDYLADLDRIRSHFRALGQNRLRLLPMGERQARQVIALGASLLAPGVEDRILKFVAGGADNLYSPEMTIAPALLSLALRELNERRLSRGPDAKITADLFDVEQQKIFEDFYLRTVQDFPPGVQTFIEDKLLTTTGYRDNRALDDALCCRDVTLPILNELVNRRLLSYEDRQKTRRVELTHDVLIPVIKASRDNRHAREALARVERQQREAFEKEREQREQREALFRAEKERLEAYEKARATHRWLLVAGVLLVLAVAGMFYGFWQAQNAHKYKELAERTRSLADFEVALLYQQKAGAVDPRALAHLARALWNLREEPLTRQYLVSMFRDRLWHRALTEPLAHEDKVNWAEFSADGARVVTASEDRTARIWDAKNGQSVGKPLWHGGGILSAAFSTDGERVVTASRDWTAQIWDAKTGQPGGTLRHGAEVNTAAFSADGARVVTASEDWTARIWDAKTGESVCELWHGLGVLSAAFSADGMRVVTASRDWTAQIWDAKTGEPAGTLRHDDEVNTAAFSADGASIVTASKDRTARIWDAKTGELGERLWHRDEVNTAAFSTDGARIVTASDDKTARIWNAKTGRPLQIRDVKTRKELDGALRHDAAVNRAVFSADGARVVTTSGDKTARIWDAKTGQPVGEPLHHEDSVYAAVFSRDGAHIVTASTDRTARIWEVNNEPTVGVPPLCHNAAVNSTGFSADGAWVVTASEDGTARIWSAKTGQSAGEPLWHGPGVLSAAFSADGARVVTASRDWTARIWDAKTGRPLQIRNVKTRKEMDVALSHDGEVNTAAFSPDGARVVTASEDHTARIWDAKTGESMCKPLWHGRGVLSAAFSADGTRVVTASEDHTAQIWDAKTGESVYEPLWHGRGVLSAAFSADGTRVVTASRDWTARIWDAKTGRPLQIRDVKIRKEMDVALSHDGEVNTAAFSADGARVVTASKDGTARIWDAITHRPVGERLRHDAEVDTAVFSADGARIVTASKDWTARIWDAKTGKPVGESLRHGDAICAAVFSVDGARIITASADKTARIWDVAVDLEARLPDWVPELAEALGGQCFNKEGVLVPPEKSIAKLRKELTDPSSMHALKGDDFWSRLGRWFFTCGPERTISPDSKITVGELDRLQAEAAAKDNVTRAKAPRGAP